MASTITALTGGGGVAVAGDTSGVLELKTNNGTTAMTIDTSQNVGIGTGSPVQYAKLTTATGNIWVSNGTANQQSDYSSFNYGLSFPDASGNPANGPGALITATGVSSYGANLQFITRPGGGGTAVERMRIASDGTITASNGNVLLVSGTAQASTSGTNIDFTGIPSWVKRITVMFSGISLSGTSHILIQAGTGSTPATTGYNSAAVSVSVSTANATNGSGSNATNGFTTAGFTNSAASTASGQFVLTNINGNTWIGSGVLYSIGNLRVATFAGDLTLGGTLGMIRVTTVNGTDTFDAGTINILYE